RRREGGGLGVDRRRLDPHRGRQGFEVRRAIHSTRRQRPLRRNGPGGAAALPRPASRRDLRGHRFSRQTSARLRAHRLLASFHPARDIPAGWTRLAGKELGMTPEQIALKPVSIRLLLQPDHRRARERYLRSAKEAISFYGLWFGAYPYETLTIVDPPEDGF